MRYMVEKNVVRMIGPIWMPASIAAMQKDLTSRDIEDILGYTEHLHGERKLTREAIAHWLSLNSGDFQGVDDFYASIGDQEFPWEKEESEIEYNDCMRGNAF
jgi:hypothetical protein